VVDDPIMSARSQNNNFGPLSSPLWGTGVTAETSARGRRRMRILWPEGRRRDAVEGLPEGQNVDEKPNQGGTYGLPTHLMLGVGCKKVPGDIGGHSKRGRYRCIQGTEASGCPTQR